MNYTKKQIDDLKKDPRLVQMVLARIPSLEQVGKEFKGLCPFHEESTPSFTVRQEEDGTFLFYCFGCQKQGNLLQFVQWRDNIGFNDAVQKVNSFLEWKGGKENVDSAFKPIKEEKEFLTFPINRIIETEIALANSAIGLHWLAGRGINLETAAKLRWGFVQSARAVNPHHTWCDSGWMVFPTIEGEKIVSLKYRSVMGKKNLETKEEGFLRKTGMKTCLYNLGAIDPFSDVFIVEGEPDVAILTQAGFAAVGFPSASYTPTADEKDKLNQANRIFLAGDSDTAGNAAMTKLWNEMRERTFRLEWPQGNKDANQTFLDKCSSNVEIFRAEVEKLMAKALEQPMPFMFDIRESFQRSDDTKPMDRADRLRMPWEHIDNWTAILPGDVMAVSATETGTGKTSWVMQILLHNAIKYGKIIANYSGEVLPPQYARRAAAHLVNRPKDEIGREDFLQAAEIMKDARFYNGYKPGANYKDVIELLKWAKRRLGADIIVVDHLHFLTRGERDETKAQSEAMRMIKDMALDFNIIPIVLGQPRKPLANHRGRVMVTQDLKGSESFGSDASQVFILHRDRKSTGEDENMPIFDPVTTVKLDKSRESEPRATKLVFDGARCTFNLLERNYGEYDAE